MNDDLARRVLRSLVPAALALGFLAVYPSVAPRVVERLGSGFSPAYVALYVTTLVGLFLLDAWFRDRRVSRLVEAAAEAERRADGLRQRSDELGFVLDVARDLDGEARLESALFTVLERLREVLPFEVGYVFLLDAAGRPTRRGICPLTATPSADARRFVERALAEAAEDDAPGILTEPCPPTAEGGRVRIATCVRAARRTIGAVVLDGADALGEHDRARLLAVADRLGATLNGLRLLEQVEAKERALRRAYRELREQGGRLARTSAIEEAGALGHAASEALRDPSRDALGEVRRLERDAAAAGDDETLRRVRRLKRTLQAIHDLGDELSDVGRSVGRPARCSVNDVLVSSLDLATPDLKRAGIEVRMNLDAEVPDVVMDEGVLIHVLTRAIRTARASLRRVPGPRRLTIETRARGEGVVVRLRDNGAGISPRRRAQRMRPAEPAGTSLGRALRRASRDLTAADLTAHGVSVDSEARLGEGSVLAVRLRGVREPEVHGTSTDGAL